MAREIIEKTRARMAAHGTVDLDYSFARLVQIAIGEDRGHLSFGVFNHPERMTPENQDDSCTGKYVVDIHDSLVWDVEYFRRKDSAPKILPTNRILDFYMGDTEIGIYQFGPRVFNAEYNVEPAEKEADAQFWGIYILLKDGTWEWVKDVDSKEEARAFVENALSNLA